MKIALDGAPAYRQVALRFANCPVGKSGGLNHFSPMSWEKVFWSEYTTLFVTIGLYLEYRRIYFCCATILFKYKLFYIFLSSPEFKSIVFLQNMQNLSNFCPICLIHVFGAIKHWLLGSIQIQHYGPSRKNRPLGIRITNNIGN